MMLQRVPVCSSLETCVWYEPVMWNVISGSVSAGPGVTADRSRSLRCTCVSFRQSAQMGSLQLSDFRCVHHATVGAQRRRRSVGPIPLWSRQNSARHCEEENLRYNEIIFIHNHIYIYLFTFLDYLLSFLILLTYIINMHFKSIRSKRTKLKTTFPLEEVSLERSLFSPRWKGRECYWLNLVSYTLKKKICNNYQTYFV